MKNRLSIQEITIEFNCKVGTGRLSETFPFCVLLNGSFVVQGSETTARQADNWLTCRMGSSRFENRPCSFTFAVMPSALLVSQNLMVGGATSPK